MTTYHNSSSSTHVLELFSTNRLAHEIGLKAALCHLDALGGHSGLQPAIEHLLSFPHVFAYIVSVWDRSAEMVSQVMSDFPTDAQEYHLSLAHKMLDTVSVYAQALPTESLAREVAKDIGRYRVFIEGAQPVLCALSTMKFADAKSLKTWSDPDPFGVEPDDRVVNMQASRVTRKRDCQDARVTINASLFVKIGMDVPPTSETATSLSIHILAELKKILSFYLSLLRRTELVGDIKALLFPNVEESAKDVVPEISFPEDTESSTEQSAYPMVQPMKAALYFDNANGFGEWRILISTEAYKHLREHRRADKKIFKIIYKKIKLLSHGQFSADNHKRLNGSDAGIPVFEAKMTKDLRLVYQIDCVPDQDGESERQVIKVYGIYRHSELGRIWNALGNHLARKGVEYRRRCIFRTKPADNIILPASFPPKEPEPEIPASPLDLSAKEIEHLHSLLVLEKYVAFSQAFLHSLIANQDVHHVFELSLQEQKVVKCTTSCYVLGRSGTGKTTTMLFKILGIQRAWELSSPDMPKPRQIFVTKSRMLATKVEEYFMRLSESLAMAGYTLPEIAKLKAQSIEDDLIDHDDTPESQINVPAKYSQLGDNHFPLFVTFDQLAKMIAADIFNMDDPETKRSAALFFDTNDPEALDSFVTYDVFEKQYWPHFPQGLTKNLNSWLVFSEFMGIIKGSEQALGFPGGFLDRSSYLCLPCRSNPIFANQRDILYDIFEIYRKFKKQKRHFDVADRTHAILKVLRNQKFPGQQVDYVYVDEAQDNLLIDALVLRRLCRNSDGLFWAGDTAQTISAGSSFRFNDLKAFVYRMERHSSSVTPTGAPARQPTMFQLATNYRSHNGIVNCAHSVIQLITKFWPDAIDHLQPEKGVVDGVKPVFFTDLDNDTPCKRFLVGESPGNFELGARQCILVRNEAAAKKVQEEVGEIGMIMTLYNSKGLEFDDVLLYNFFEDSAVDASRWQVVLNGVQGQGYAPNFSRDETRYAGICSELKLLYVGITRAKKNVWIFDTSDKSDAIRIFWESQNLIRTCARSTDVSPLAVTSTPEEWASSGRLLFMHKCYAQAIHCFKRADLHREVKVCEAYLLRKAARSIDWGTLLNVQQRAFTTAADAFADCGAAATGNERHQYYLTSADCYVRGGQDLKAAHTYLKAEEFELAAKRYRKAGSFDRTLRVLTAHRAVISEKTVTDLQLVCRLHYCSRSNDQAPATLFSSFEEKLEFLEEYDLDCARISLLESRSMHYEVAKIHLSENRPVEAVQAFLKDNRNIDSATRAADTLLEFMWRKCSFRVALKAAIVDDSVRQAIALADQLQTKKLKPMTRNLVLMFQSILREDHELLKKLALIFQEHGHHTAALHCLDHFFTQSIDIRPFQLHEMTSFLGTFYTYARLLYQTSTLLDPLGRRECDVQRLFSIVPLAGDEFLIPNGTFLYDSATKTPQNNRLVSMHQSGYKASRRNTTELIRQSIRTVLKDKLLALDVMCRGAPVFLQCLPFVVYGNCRRKECPQEHITMSNLDRVQYNAHVAIHMQLILILQLLHSAQRSAMKWESMRYWLEHLYEALTPPLFIQGSFADLDLTLIPHGLAGLRAVKTWIRESFYCLSPSKSPYFLTTLMRITSLSFTFDPHDACSYITQAKCLTSNIPTKLLREPDNHNLVVDMLNSYRGATPSSISAGVLFLLHVLNNRLRVNLSVLCDCIEDILSSFVINHRMNPTLNELPLDGVVLPSNWLIFPYKFSVKKDVEAQSIGKLLDAIENLTKRLRVDGAMDFLWLAHDTSVIPLLCDIFIFRLCRTLCLVAHNTRYPMVKRKVNSIILHLHRPQRPAYYQELVDKVVEHVALIPGRRVPRVDGYLQAVLDLDNNAASNLVELVHKTKQSTRTPSVRQLLYVKASEIPYLLSSHMVAAQSMLRPEAAPFVPRMQRPKNDIKIRQAEKEILKPIPQEVDEVKEKEISVAIDSVATDGMEDMDEAVTSLDPVPDESLRFNGPSEEQNWAARRIQYAFRYHVWHRSGSAVDAEIDAIFTICLKETQSSKWGPSYYRLLFLGPLPHLLACLEQGITLIHTAKAKMRDLFKEVSHEKLEELCRQRSEITSLLKKGLQLHSKLEPSSLFHRTRDIDALKRAVLEVGDFIQKVPGSTKDTQANFQMAYKGIVAEKKLFRVQMKPVLSVEDHQAKKENLKLIPQEVVEVEKGVSVVVDSEATDGMEDMDEAVTSLDPVPDESLRSNGPSEEQNWAAHRIQYAYRYYIWRRSGSAIDAEIDAIFTACLKETRSSKWRPSYYRLLFLGPLPHLLACLEQGITLTHTAKAKTKDLLKEVSHEQLEESGKQRSEITSLLKKGMQLRSKLEPSSPFHRSRDIDALKRAVLEVGDFIQKVPGSTKDMQAKFQIAYKGIVAEKKLFRVQMKPVLNVDDL